MRSFLVGLAAILFAALLALGPNAIAMFGSPLMSGGATGGGGGGGGSVACAVGPNAASTPTNASIAGYTTCLFDMEPSVGGGFWANTANYMINCGANGGNPSTAGNPAKWFFTLTSSYNHGTGLPCGQSSIVTDGSNGRVLNLTGAAGTLGASLNWPTSQLQTNQGYLSIGHYDKIRFRIDCATQFQNGGTCSPGNPGGEVIFWSSATGDPGVDDDGWESTVGIGHLTSYGWCSYHGYHYDSVDGYLGSAGDYMCFGAGASSPTVDMTQMHTLEFLWTNNGATASSLVLCAWIDGTLGGCLNDSAPPDGNLPFTDQSRSFFLAATAGGGTQVNIPDTANIWVQSWQEWACPGVGSSVCSGSALVNGPPPALTYWH